MSDALPTTPPSLRGLRCLVGAVILVAACGVQAQDAAGALRERHTTLADKLSGNQFKRPLHLESVETSNNQRGDVYAEVAYPFAVLKRSMQGAGQWCDILILHLNVKRCRVEAAPTPKLSVSIGKKTEDVAEDASKVEFAYRLAENTDQYFQVLMSAPAGPLGTRDYRIAVEAVPLDAQRSFVHMSYSYGYGVAARLAMQAYLATVGASKVGFSSTGRTPEGKPMFVTGVRGVVERNTMRYYLAIEAYLASLAVPPAEQTDKRIRDWFAATEEFPLQLRELPQADYVRMKQRETQP